MIKKLRTIFSSLRVYQEDIDHFDQNYNWFLTPAQDIIGIKQEELTTKEASLLATFLQPYNTVFPVMTETEKKWEQILYTATNPTHFDIEHPYRFVCFSIKQNQINPSSFKEAIQELFAEPIPILWINSHSGIIIEEQTLTEENISYEDIIDILMSDLYVNINFFVGSFQTGLTDVKRYYQTVITSAETALIYSKKAVMTYTEVVPFLFINQMEPKHRQHIAETILQDYLDDEETLKMIQVFVECNLNVSETAKELYMHRNSLQYRLDRFQENTSIDIRQFQHAMTVYLALIAKT